MKTYPISIASSQRNNTLLSSVYPCRVDVPGMWDDANRHNIKPLNVNEDEASNEIMRGIWFAIKRP
jgi:hypothetical protein